MLLIPGRLKVWIILNWAEVRDQIQRRQEVFDKLDQSVMWQRSWCLVLLCNFEGYFNKIKDSKENVHPIYYRPINIVQNMTWLHSYWNPLYNVCIIDNWFVTASRVSVVSSQQEVVRPSLLLLRLFNMITDIHRVYPKRWRLVYMCYVYYL